VVLYRSRAKGNYHNGSDIDITIFGEDLSLQINAELSMFYTISHLKNYVKRLNNIAKTPINKFYVFEPKNEWREAKV
jgi:predicted nucleotidyltransferase